MMIYDEILQYCLNHLECTVLVNSWGEKGIFYNPNNTLKRGVYILTVKEKDGENDEYLHIIHATSEKEAKSVYQKLILPSEVNEIL